MSIEKQLEESVRHSHIQGNRLQDRQFEVQRLTAILTNLQNKIQDSSDRYEQKVIQLQEQLTEKEQLIAAMMTSKFWKIRSMWFKIKNNLGLKGE